MKKMRSIVCGVAGLSGLVALGPLPGCAPKPPQYGSEYIMALPGARQEVWAVAPAVNLSGQPDVDALLQADLAYQQLQQVRGVTVVPVNRVAEVYASLQIVQAQSAEQALLVCDLLGCDALVVPTVTAYDPYNPPKFGASLQMFRKSGTYVRPAALDPRELSRAATPGETESLPADSGFAQAVGMFDAANGSTRDKLLVYARGRHDPLGPMGEKEYLVSMDRYCGFVYHELTGDLLSSLRPKRKRR